MQKLWLALCLIFGLGLAPAQAQVVNNPTSTAPAGAYNLSPITCTDGKFCLLQTDIHGYLKVNVAAGAASGCAGTAGTPCIVSGNGTAGTADVGVVTVQGIAAMTPIGISIASGKVASGAFASGSIASGAMVDLGAQADSACANGSSTCSLIAVNKGVLTAAQAPIPAQTPSAATGIGAVSVDPCSYATKTNLSISFQTTSLTQQIAASGSTKIYVCSVMLITSGATVFSIVGGTGTNCGTPTALVGTTSATHGVSLAANGGYSQGSGSGSVITTPASSELCLVQSGAGDLVGNMTYVQQ